VNGWERTRRRDRSYFGDSDPFGDFDLLFGASKLNLKILDLPIRYKERRLRSNQYPATEAWLAPVAK
jgi:pectin methylesterase-like acyl-CoA thioesterase